MKNPLFKTIVEAIDGHYLVRVTDEIGPRLIEPYLIFESAAGDMLLHGWQRSGAFHSTPPPHWCNLHLEDLVEVSVLNARFARPRHDYNPQSARFHRVLYSIDERGSRENPHAVSADCGIVRVRRRGPPTARSSENSSRAWKRR